MNLNEARSLAVSLMRQHGLSEWSFKFDGALRRLGQCQYRTKTISLSKAITRLNPVEQVRNTILHECAHAMLGHGYGHGHQWKTLAMSIGCNGEVTTNTIVRVKPEHSITCGTCGRSWNVFRRPGNLATSYHRNCGRDSMGQLSYK